MTGGGSTFVEGGLRVLPSGVAGATPVGGAGVEAHTQKGILAILIKFCALHAFNLIKPQEPDRSMNFGMNEWT